MSGRRTDSHSVSRDARRGFTIVEMLVVISLISILAALVLPAVATIRASSRRMQCANNIRNLGIAMTNVADSTGRLPASGNFGFNPNRSIKICHSWVLDILPWIEQRQIYDRYDFDAASDRGSNFELAHTDIAVLMCPSDFTLEKTGSDPGGNLSYVVNGGFGFTTGRNGVGDCAVDFTEKPLDLNGNGVVCPAKEALDGEPSDKVFYKMTGVFFLENWPRVLPGQPGTRRFHRLGDITDGLSQTIFLSENLRTGRDPNFSKATWATPMGFRSSFFLPSDVCTDNKCSDGNVDYARANRGKSAINAGLEQAEGESPWPSSDHLGGVNVFFGDGHAKFLSEKIDGRVYAALMTPQGARIVGPLAQQPISDADY